jgi:hypothetical protein
LRELNKTNLKGINGLAKARIEISYKQLKKENKYDNINAVESEDEKYKTDDNIPSDDDIKDKENIINRTSNKNVCFICHLPGHFAKDCILTKEMCYECGERVCKLLNILGSHC